MQKYRFMIIFFTYYILRAMQYGSLLTRLQTNGENPKGRRVDSNIKRMGALIGNFEKKPKEVPRHHFVGIAWNFFDPKEVSIMFNTLTDRYQMTCYLIIA